MSEKKTRNTEAPVNHSEHTPHHERVQAPEHHQERAKEYSTEQQEKSLEDIRRTVEASATGSEDLKKDEFQDTKHETTPVFVQQELKKITFKKTLSKVQKELPVTERVFSKVVHAPVIDKMSSVGEKTVARPIGILGGGALALLGSLLSTYFSRRFGMTYNIFMFVIFFTVGYMFTTILELIYINFIKSRNN